MTKLINSLKKRKGFTLVEVIIVLVILAILAAVLIPSLTGYIDKANEKASIANARNFVVAMQTIASETYGEKGTLTSGDSGNISASDVDAARKLAESPSGAYAQVLVTPKGKVEAVNFWDGKYFVTYNYSETNGASYTAYSLNDAVSTDKVNNPATTTASALTSDALTVGTAT